MTGTKVLGKNDKQVDVRGFSEDPDYLVTRYKGGLSTTLNQLPPVDISTVKRITLRDGYIQLVSHNIELLNKDSEVIKSMSLGEAFVLKRSIDALLEGITVDE